MAKLVRFGVSLDKELLGRFDTHIQGKKYNNRSEALRDMIRQELVAEEWREGGEVAGAITLIYDHHQRELMTKIIGIQHGFHDIIISTQHVHLDHDHCLEIIAVRGTAKRAQELADVLRAIKGVKHGTLSMSTTARDLS